MAPKLRVALIGNLCDNAVIFGRLLKTEDLQISLYMDCKELQDCTLPEVLDEGEPVLEKRIEALKKRDPRVFIWDYAPGWKWISSLPFGETLFRSLMAIRFALRLRKEDVILSFAMYHIVAWLSGKPYIATSTGADLHEMAVEKSIKGALMRRAFKRANSVRASYDPLSRRNAIRLKLGDLSPFLIPWSVPEKPVAPVVKEGPIRVFMPARLDWTDTSRAGIAKRNDLFIRGWARMVNEGWDSMLTIVAHGDDVDATKSLVGELGVGDRVEFIPRLDQASLQEQIEGCDLVADQFDQGTQGAISLQAMATGRALAMYWDPSFSKFSFSSVPPIINGKTVEELYDGLRENPGREDMQKLGHQAHEWIRREFDADRLRSQLRLAISLATGVPLALSEDDAGN